MPNISNKTTNNKIIGKEMDLNVVKFLLVTSNSISMPPTPFLGKTKTTLIDRRYLLHSFAIEQQSSI